MTYNVHIQHEIKPKKRWDGIPLENFQDKTHLMYASLRSERARACEIEWRQRVTCHGSTSLVRNNNFQLAFSITNERAEVFAWKFAWIEIPAKHDSLDMFKQQSHRENDSNKKRFIFASVLCIRPRLTRHQQLRQSPLHLDPVDAREVAFIHTSSQFVSDRFPNAKLWGDCEADDALSSTYCPTCEADHQAWLATHEAG